MSYDILKFNKVSKKFGDCYAVNDVSLSIKKGEFFTLLGPSGSGKTTLLRICAGIETLNNGSIILDNNDITNLPPHLRKVNTVFQDYALFPHMNVYENIIFGPKLMNWSDNKISHDANFFLKLIQMHDCKHKYPNQLSGGQKQRVAIARALINRPLVLLLDEPFAALDLKLRQKMVVELDTIHHEIGTTFLLVTHDQSEAMSISDRIAVMRKGNIEQIGTPTEIYEAPKNSFVAAFIGDTNFFEGTVINVINEEISKIQPDNFNEIFIYNDKKLHNGLKVHLSIRPEKIKISRNYPKINNKYLNVLQGTVDDVVYFGFQTKFWVNVDNYYYISVIKQHNSYLLDEKPIIYKDSVWIYWNPEFGYLMDNYSEHDEKLLTIPLRHGEYESKN